MGHRRRNATAAFLLTVALVGASGVPAARGAATCPGVQTRGAWNRISAPLRAAAFTADAAGRLYVAGDRVLMTSADGGCTWGQAATVEDPLPLDARITALATAGNTVVAAVTGPSVLVSADGGSTWERHAEGLDVPGDPIGLYPAGSGDVVYMLVRRKVTDQGLEAAGLWELGVSALVTVVYRSDDGGRTWTRGDGFGTSYTGPHGSGVDGGSTPGAAWDLAVDPADPDHLLAAARDGVFRSVDGGRTWGAAVFDPGVQIRTVALWRTAGGHPAAVAVDPLSGTVYEAADAAGPWRTKVYPQLRTEMMTTYPNATAWAWAASDSAGQVWLSGPKGVFRLGGSGLIDVTPPDLAGPGATLADLAVLDTPPGPAPWARLLDGSAIVTEVGAPPRSGPATDESRGSTNAGASGWPGKVPVAHVPEPRAVLEAPVRRIALAPGEARTLSYEARLGPRPASVDLYFLVDTTSSMSNTIRALVAGMQDIVTRLARSRIRLRVGVGAFRTYPRESDLLAVNYAYRRLRALGPVDDELLAALYELEGGGSSGANLTAALQAVTGAGQDVLPPGPSKADVPAGGAAGFRAGSLKVVMHFGDTWFGTPERGDPNGYYAPGTWPGPPFEAVAAALRGAGVRHLGVALQPGEGGTVFADADVVGDMKALSRATSSLAGTRGADCDDDGRPDLRAGDPLVCLLPRGADAGRVASVVTGLVEALEERGDVELVESVASGLVRRITPGAHRGVDLRARQRLAFDVTVACGLGDAGTRRTVDLDLLVAHRRAATSALVVTCTELPAPPPPDPVGRGAPPLALLSPIPVPPPPHPVPGPGLGSVTAPAPVQAPAPAQAPGGHPQTATVAQRQQQPQAALAVALQQVREQTQMQHALVRTQARNPLATARLWTAVGALSLLWAWGLATVAVTSARRARV